MRKTTRSQVGKAIREGMRRAHRGAGPAWFARAYSTVLGLCVLKRYVHANDVWDTDLPIPRNGPRALGPVMNAIARDGYMRKTGRRKPSNLARRLKMVVWRSTVHA